MKDFLAIALFCIAAFLSCGIPMFGLLAATARADVDRRDLVALAGLVGLVVLIVAVLVAAGIELL